MSFLRQRPSDRRAVEAMDRGRMFAYGRSLPSALADGIDEAAIELGWALGRAPHGEVLSVGPRMNRRHVLDALLPMVDGLTLVTTDARQRFFTGRGVSYEFADPAALPHPDATFDVSIALSPGHPREEAGELRRVTVEGGEVLLTATWSETEGPTSEPPDGDDVSDLLEVLRPSSHSLRVFARHGGRWRLADLDRLARRRAVGCDAAVVCLAAGL